MCAMHLCCCSSVLLSKINKSRAWQCKKCVLHLCLMEIINLLHLSSRGELRRWLIENYDKEKCCWVVTYRGKCSPEWPAVPYVEVVEEALCFGWIDSTLKRLLDGRLVQRLSPRRAKSHWTQLNVDRFMALEGRGVMTEAGRRAFENVFEYGTVTPGYEVAKE